MHLTILHLSGALALQLKPSLKNCGCDLQFSAGDLLPRIMLEGSSTDADIVIGLNTDVTKKARETGLFAEHGQNNADLKLPIEWTDGTFLPFDWAYVSFVYNADKMSTMPSSFEDLVNLPADHKIVIQDPRSSISGLALVLWVKAVYGDKAADYWTRLSPNILTVTSGWSEAYGLFTEGEADVCYHSTHRPATTSSRKRTKPKKRQFSKKVIIPTLNWSPKFHQRMYQMWQMHL